ncbi:tyrosine-type recombinase/integrase [Bradyrhizobium sp. 27S5]|uniref:tyrosine-type recombinase/integrase n=1 Tax=Bradyrhizobium sp. 27S5 TaxID=3139728 RepID=UPI0030D04FB0
MPAKHPHLLANDGWWHFYRRVPKRMAELDKRHAVKKATKIRVADDPKALKATKAVIILNDGLEADWRDMIAGRNDAARSHLREAAKRAQQFGFGYHTASEIAERQLDEILKRIDQFGNGASIDEKVDRIALVGGTGRATVMLSQLPAELQSLKATEIRGKSPQQLKKWRASRDAPVNRLTGVIGDKDMLAITRDDAKAFREWWSTRITEEDLTEEGARKDINALSAMIAEICKRDQLTDPKIFSGLGFRRSKGKRIAFDIDFVRTVILKPGALDGMPQVAFDILMVCIETGARVSEIVNLQRQHIKLMHNIPHIAIRDDGREVKTKNAIREVPLVGIALEAMRRNPNGFPDYYDNANEASKAINKWLKALQPDVNEDDGDRFKTLHCLRHTFKDRLRAVRAEDEMKVALMGHDTGSTGNTPDYGEGYSLQAKLAVVHQIAFPVARLIAQAAA